MIIFGVIVCYNPNLNSLLSLCNCILSTGSKVVLVDNTTESYITDFQEIEGLTLIQFGENKGIARAQNIGVTFSLDNNADVIVFFDQDSEIDSGFIGKLTAPLKDNKPMVVSPFFFDKETGFQFPSMRLNKWGLLKKTSIENFDCPFEVDVIISSGSAATRKTFEIVGLMNEDYFIDFVDTEWCLRCRNEGIKILVVPNAVMQHSIGEKSIDLKIMRLFIHGPIRTYYKVRNSFLFVRSSSVPVLMGLKEILSALIPNLLVIFFVDNKWKYLKCYTEAIVDGLFYRKGKKY